MWGDGAGVAERKRPTWAQTKSDVRSKGKTQPSARQGAVAATSSPRATSTSRRTPVNLEGSFQPGPSVPLHPPGPSVVTSEDHLPFEDDDLDIPDHTDDPHFLSNSFDRDPPSELAPPSHLLLAHEFAPEPFMADGLDEHDDTAILASTSPTHRREASSPMHDHPSRPIDMTHRWTNLHTSPPASLAPSEMQAPLERYDWRTRATSQINHRGYAIARPPMIKRLKASGGEKLQPGHVLFEAMTAYRQKFDALMKAEHAVTAKMVIDRLNDCSVRQLVGQGFCLDELGARWEWKMEFGRPCATFARVGKRGTGYLPWNKFEPGSVVILSRTDYRTDALKRKHLFPGGENPEELIVCSVVRKSAGSVTLSFETKYPDLTEGLWRLDLWTSDIILRRMQQAVQSLQDDPSQQLRRDADDRARPTLGFSAPSFQTAQEQVDGFVKPSLPEESMLSGTTLRDVILQAFKPDSEPALEEMPTVGAFASDQLIESWCRRHLIESREPLAMPGDPELSMNRSQVRAIALMISQRLSLIQGPPGTGKTRTIIETIHLLKRHWQIPQPILVSAYTNAAVDNLAAGLRKRGLKTLRFGASSRIRDDNLDLSLEEAMNVHPSKDSLEYLRFELGRAEVGSTMQTYYRNKIFGLQRKILTDIYSRVDVICSTCISSMSKLLEVIDFPVVFLDEASMATEPGSLMPLVKGCAHLAIIGDHKQLPPIIMSEEARDGGLNLSLFERLMQEGRVPRIMLDTQYRMHPSISAFPNKAFYNSALSDGTPASQLLPPVCAYLPIVGGEQQNIGFVHVNDVESTRSHSIRNVGQAERVIDVVADLLLANPTLRALDIGIITPYTAQIACIDNHLRHDELRRQAFTTLLGEKRAMELADIEVKSVDGFEGREKEVIIFSTVRSNPEGFVGFLDDWRRMNVGLTRARRAMILIGNFDTLSNARAGRSSMADAAHRGGEQYWKILMRDLRSQKAVIEVTAG